MNKTNKTLVLVNPASGGGRACRLRPRVEDLLHHYEVPAEFVETRGVEDLQQRAAGAHAAGFDTLAVLGGDGALHHAVNAAIQTGSGVPRFAFFPAGNGNDIARNFGIPLDTIAAAYAFARGRSRRFDAAQVRFSDGATRIFLGAGGMGLDAEAAQLVAGKFRQWPGAARYVAAALYALKNFAPLQLAAAIDGAPWSGEVLLAAVANGPCYGAGIRIEPAARVDDGELNLVLAAPLPLTKILEAIPVLLRSGDLRWPQITRLRAKRLVLRADRPALFHGDGEILGRAPVEIEVLPAAVEFIF